MKWMGHFSSTTHEMWIFKSHDTHISLTSDPQSHTQCHYCSQTCVQEKYPAACCQVCAALMHVTATNPMHLLENTDVSAALRHQLCSVWLQRGTRPAETILTQTGTTWWHLSPSNKHLWGIVSWISHYVGDHTLAKSYGCICLDLPSPRVSKHI